MKKDTSWNLERAKSYPNLEGNIEADAVIVGGGLAGVLSAYLLSKEGKKVVIIEKESLGMGATLKTTAFLTQVIDTSYADLLKALGKEKTKMIADSHQGAIELIGKIVEKEKIACAFEECFNYIYAENRENAKKLKAEHKAMLELGIDSSFDVNSDLGIRAKGAVEIKKQAKFHPLKFINEISKIIVKNGGKIFENTEALHVEDNSVVTESGKVEADWIIIATHSPFNNPLGLFFKKAMYVSYVLELELGKNDIPNGTYENTHNPYHYFRIDKNKDGDRVIVGGGDHRADIKMNPDKKFAALEDYASRTFKGMDYKIVRRWAGPILESIDGLAYIGLYKSKNTIYATGFSGNGMTYSGITALIVRDLVLRKKNEKNDWLELYRPGRLPNMKLLMVKGRDYIEELWNGVVRKI